jgi:hypothetical protein
MSEASQAEFAPSNRPHVIDRARQVLETGVSLKNRISQFFMRVAETRLGEVFGLDLRSMALFRILLGLLVIADIAGRVPNFRAHFTDEGVLPRELVISSMSEWRWSLFLMNGSVQFQVALFAITWIAAICIIVGYRTRLMLFIAWVLIMSLQVRNPMVLSGADTLLRLIMFWSMLLPLGAVWSVDSRRAPENRPTSNRFVSFASAGLLIQIAIMYWFTVLLKDGPTWRGDGTALFYATGAGQITRPIGEYLHQFPDLLKLMTHIGFGIESIAPLLLFLPFRNGILRIIGIGAIISLHVGIWLIMDVALFPWTSSLVMFAFLPASFWAFSSARYARLVDMIQRRAERPRTRRLLPELPSLSPAVSGSGAQDFTTVEPRSAGISSAIIQRLAAVIRPRDTDATNEKQSPVTPRVQRSSWLLNAFAAFCIVFVLAWNIPSVTAFTMPQSSVPVAYSLGLYQKWNMFAPNPPNATVWYVVRGYVEGGEAVDLVTPFVYDDIEHAVAFSWDEPDDIVSGYYKDKYWRKYFSAIARDTYADERKEFARYACHEWNAHYGGDARLDKIQMIMIKKPTLMDGGQGQEQRKLLAQYTCA